MEIKPKTRLQWKKIALIVAGGLALLCVLCIAIPLIYAETPAGKASLSRTHATQTASSNSTAVAAASLAVPNATGTVITVPVATANPAPLPMVTATSIRTLVPTKTHVPTNTPLPIRTLTSTLAPTVTIEPSAAGLPGLLPADVRVNVEDQFGMSCNGPNTRGGITTWACIRNVGTAVLRVDIYSLGGLQVDIIDARIAGFFNADTAAKFLGFIATMPYDGAEPATARLWVINNISKAKAETTMGNVWFELSGDDSLRELIMSKP